MAPRLRACLAVAAWCSACSGSARQLARARRPRQPPTGAIQRDRGRGQRAHRAGDDPAATCRSSRRAVRPGRARPVARRPCSPPACSPTSTLAARATRLIVSVVENPIINRMAFEGNRRLDDKLLEPRSSSARACVYTRSRVQNDVQRILELYRRNGRFAATRRAEGDRARRRTASTWSSRSTRGRRPASAASTSSATSSSATARCAA